MSVAKRRERKEREKANRKNEILQSAITVFSKNGFVKTSMEMVADEAELAVGTLYRYYSGKEELFVSIVFDAIMEMNEKHKELAEDEMPPDEKLKCLWNYYYQFHQNRPMYYQALLFLHDPSFARAFSDSAHDTVNRVTDENFSLIARIIADGMDANVFAPGNPHEAADFIWSTFVGLVNLTETRVQFGSTASDLGKSHRAMWHWIERSLFI